MQRIFSSTSNDLEPPRVDVPSLTLILIGGKRDAQHHRLRAKVEAPIRLVAIPDAKELEDAILVGFLFDTQELPVLLGIGWPEIDAAKESSHKEMVVFELGNQNAPRRLRIPHGAIVAGRSIRHHRVPRSERQGLGDLALFLGRGLELTFETVLTFRYSMAGHTFGSMAGQSLEL